MKIRRRPPAALIDAALLTLLDYLVRTDAGVFSSPDMNRLIHALGDPLGRIGLHSATLTFHRAWETMRQHALVDRRGGRTVASLWSVSDKDRALLTLSRTTPIQLAA